MRSGDFIITPSWTCHDHGNDGADPVVWLDGLDIPLVALPRRRLRREERRASRRPTRARGRRAAALRQQHAAARPRADAARAVARLQSIRSRARAKRSPASRRGDADPHFGFKLRFVNPATGRSPMPTIGTFAQRLPAGFETRPYRSSDGTVLRLPRRRAAGRRSADASRSTSAGATSSSCRRGSRARSRRRRDASLFSFSDRPVQQVLGLWREERL